MGETRLWQRAVQRLRAGCHRKAVRDLTISYDLPAGSDETGCVFCDVASGRQRRDLLFVDEQVVAFASKNPRAQKHFLVVPKRHISTIESLTPHDLPLIRHMRLVGIELLRQHAGGRFGGDAGTGPDLATADQVGVGVRLGFHAPPFHSVEHLHMHCLAPPFTQPLAALRYAPTSFWFVAVQQLVDRLQSASEDEPS